MTASLDVKSPEMALIHDSCQDARARIEFFRVAFGTYQTGQMMDDPKVQVSPMPFTPHPVLICAGILKMRSTEHGHR